jgi:8-oxo-dGTP pyrophosphatase MutT (NUDIX family)
MVSSVYIYDKPLFLCEGPPSLEQWKSFHLVNFYTGPSDWTSVMHMLKHQLIHSVCLWFASGEMEAAVKEFFVPMKAAGGLVKNPQGDYLCIKRLGRWDLPKGKLEHGEDVASCAVREVEEECGLKNPGIVRPLGETLHAYEHHNRYILKTTYWFEMISQDNHQALVPQESEQITDAAWVSKNQLPEILASTYPSIREVFHKAIH